MCYGVGGRCAARGNHTPGDQTLALKVHLPDKNMKIMGYVCIVLLNLWISLHSRCCVVNCRNFIFSILFSVKHKGVKLFHVHKMNQEINKNINIIYLPTKKKTHEQLLPVLISQTLLYTLLVSFSPGIKKNIKRFLKFWKSSINRFF